MAHPDTMVDDEVRVPGDVGAESEAALRASRIDEADINGEFVRFAGTLAFWGARLADAHEVALRNKARGEHTYAIVKLAARDKLERLGVKATESQVDAHATIDPRWRAQRDRDVDAEVNVKRLAALVEALRAKRDMLVSLGAHVRAELGPPPSIRERG